MSYRIPAHRPVRVLRSAFFTYLCPHPPSRRSEDRHAMSQPAATTVAKNLGA
jgi:hypothetical protein